MLNLLGPYRWLIEAGFVLAMVLGIVFGIHHYGALRYEDGITHQKGIDQGIFDRVNQQLTDQKAVAAKMISDRDLQIIALQQAQAAQRAQQEKQHDQDVAATDAARRDAAASRLRITIPVSQVAGCGVGRGVDVPGPSTSPVTSGTEVLDLPEAYRRGLLDIAFDADKLADDYRRCYRAFYPNWKSVTP